MARAKTNTVKKETTLVDRALYMSQKLETLNAKQMKEFRLILNTEHDLSFDQIFEQVKQRGV
jgi:uncharacterized glyoxalase superfamily protein PhnB